MIIKPSRYTRRDFMFLLRFVHRRRPQIIVHSITFEQPFVFLLFLARLLALTYRLPDLKLVDFRRDLGQMFKVKYAICYIATKKWSDCHGIFKVNYGICYTSAKNGPIAKKRKANIAIELEASNVTIRFGIRNQESFIRGNLQYMQFTKGYIQFLLYILMWVVGCCKTVWLEETHIN